MKSIEGIKNSIKAIEDRNNSEMQFLYFNSDEEREQYRATHPHIDKENILLIVMSETERKML